MNKIEELRAAVATMLMVSQDEVSSQTSLKPLATSLGSAKLRLALKRLGFAQPFGSVPATYGRLVAAVSGETAPPDTHSPMTFSRSILDTGNGGPNLLSGLQVGLDVEQIGSLPPASDFWEHEFYCATFARSEIAYAVLQADPRVHFAGFWCAKEALRKCDPEFGALSMAHTAVAHDPSGRPYLTIGTEVGVERLGHALSISHTAEIATAVVVWTPAGDVAPVVSLKPAAAPVEKKTTRWAKLFSAG